jgi:hypothetical protein
MLNLHTIEMLLDALAPMTGLVLVGDVDQLPPIGPASPSPISSTAARSLSCGSLGSSARPRGR